jgi:hypothetical protein
MARAMIDNRLAPMPSPGVDSTDCLAWTDQAREFHWRPQGA